MNTNQKTKELISMLIAFTLCLTMITQNVFAMTDSSTAQVEGFVAEESQSDQSSDNSSYNETIATPSSSEESDDELPDGEVEAVDSPEWDDAVIASLSDSIVALTASGNVADDCPWFTLQNVKDAGFEDSTLAEVVYDTVHNADEDSFYADEVTFVYMYGTTFDGHLIENYYDLVDYINGNTAWTDVEKTKFLLHFFTGDIQASDMGIKSIKGLPLLSDAVEIDLSDNLIQSLSPIAWTPDEMPMFSNGIDLRGNPIHEWPSFLGAGTGANTYSFITSTSVISDTAFRYHYGDTATANVTLGVSNTNAGGDVWEVSGGSSPLITDPKQTTVPTFSINLDTITGNIASFNAQISQENSFTGTDYSQLIGRYYLNQQHIIDEENDYWKFRLGDQQRNTFSYTYGVATQLYAGVKQDAKAEVFGGFTFTKTNEAEDKFLSGAEYKLYTADDHQITTYYDIDSAGNKAELPLTQDDLTTDANGKIRIKYLPSGDYYLKETKAPSGYDLNPDEVPITIVGESSLTTSIAGGIPSFEHSSSAISMDPDWDNFFIGTNSYAVLGKTVSGADTTKTAADYNSDVLLTNMKMPGWASDGTYSTKVQPDDYKLIDSLQCEWKATDSNANKFKEISKVKVEMNTWNKTTGTWSETPTITTFTSLTAAKTKINSYASNSKLTGDITVTSNTIYVMKDAEVTSNTASQKDKTILPVNLDLNAKKTFDGTLSGSTGEVGNFKFTVEGEGEDGKTFTSPAYNDADGKIDFGNMAFTTEGEYTFTLKETKGTNTAINYSDSSHIVYVKIEKCEDEDDGMQATIKVDGTLVGTYTSKDTNTIASDGTITADPATIDGGTFVNALTKPECTINATKSVDVGTLVDDEFTFSLIPGSDCIGVTYRATAGGVESALPSSGWTSIKNKADGTIDFTSAFSSLVFTKEAKVYHFTLKENNVATGSSYKKDSTEYEVAITVAKDASGIWTATPSYKNKTTDHVITGNPAFENTYTPLTATSAASPDIEKTLTGSWNKATTIPAFSFSLTADASNPTDCCTGLATTATLAASSFTSGHASLTAALEMLYSMILEPTSLR